MPWVYSEPDYFKADQCDAGQFIENVFMKIHMNLHAYCEQFIPVSFIIQCIIVVSIE